MIKKIPFGCALAIALIGLTGCKPASVQITPPAQSSLSFPRAPQNLFLGVIDSRKVSAKTVNTGEVQGELMIDGALLDPIPFLKKYLADEIRARGQAVTIQTQADVRLYVSEFQTHTERSGPYAPFIIWTALKGELVGPDIREPIHSIVIREHFPRFTYSELDKPLFSKSIELVVKDTASKILSVIGAPQLSDSSLQNLSNQAIQSFDKASEETLYQLAFSQNPSSSATLTEFLQSKEKPLRLAAEFGLGVLQAKEYFPTLTAKYSSSKDSTEKATLFAAILSLGSPQAKNWANSELQRLTERDKRMENPLIFKTGRFFDLPAAKM